MLLYVIQTLSIVGEKTNTGSVGWGVERDPKSGCVSGVSRVESSFSGVVGHVLGTRIDRHRRFPRQGT